MKKWTFLILVVAVGAGIYAYSHWHKRSEQGVDQAVLTTATAGPRTITLSVKAAGDIGPDDMVSVRPEINGRISQLPVDVGDAVKKGDLLCALDDRDLQTERSSRLTDIEGAKLQLDQAQRNYERNQRLYDSGLIPQETYQDAETTYELAKNALERAQKSLSQVEDQLSKTRIVAPFDCTVLTRPVSVGQAVSGSGGVGGGTEVMTVANLKQMVIKAHLNQADVVEVKVGQVTDVQIEAVPGLKLKGTVERVAPQATIKNNIKGFETQVRLTELDPRVRPGMTANMTIPVLSAENVLTIPLAAVFTEDGNRYAYIKQSENQFIMMPIDVGVSDYQYAQVLKGVDNGQVVSLVRPPLANVVRPPEPPSANATITPPQKVAEVAAAETPATTNNTKAATANP
ncbi:MAG TPA: efflux RND transporter periplasmic adaptor subunit [Verrucomicrobiae bacterium]|nr:efflux RND transporter periplasmic adaptor subunit [Verrucomicrobiae bacterium]